ncbi:hypothetical protein [Vibrio splendidus]|uniref:hypothetical protein n=1 Tax=Vibrio splendidus TaxID=29497 RepID=UPI00076A4E98|nr:hypothetical protein [Vibrio splendidus]PHX05311.1 hypothetical protein VSPL_30940 [Vibrio splendidus]
MTNYKHSLIALGVISALTLSHSVTAAENEVHDADPRNTAWRGGIASDDNGEIKLVAGGGFNNLYGGDGIETQTIMIGEYFTQSEDFRFRLANFDSRFGGVYVDTYLTDTADMYTVGYMLPLTATNGKTMFFPSVNYSYVDFDTDQIAQNIQGTIVPNSMSGYSTGTGQTALNNALMNINGSAVKDVLGGDDAHMASVNLYGLQPWNDTFYTVFQAFGGSSYGGVDMEMVDLMLLQGTRTEVGGAIFNIYLEAKYTNIKMNDINMPHKDYLRGEETKISVGFDWRF